jgi:flagellar biosynthesis/type III secretory pathway M-ring protein FliF/YscJ
MDVSALAIAALLLLVVALGAASVIRRRAARRAEQQRARARARRRRVPAVSANVRGLAPAETDLWAEETNLAERRDRVA